LDDIRITLDWIFFSLSIFAHPFLKQNKLYEKSRNSNFESWNQIWFQNPYRSSFIGLTRCVMSILIYFNTFAIFISFHNEVYSIFFHPIIMPRNAFLSADFFFFFRFECYSQFFSSFLVPPTELVRLTPCNFDFWTYILYTIPYFIISTPFCLLIRNFHHFCHFFALFFHSH